MDTGRTPEAQSASARAAQPGARRAFARRIECEGASAPRGTPARGGGRRDPEAWEQLRSARG